MKYSIVAISIHAPLRERLEFIFWRTWRILRFQSTLPYGSDFAAGVILARGQHFNPRSLTGATTKEHYADKPQGISIHAPLRERLRKRQAALGATDFNPRSLTGATCFHTLLRAMALISIHAPLRERLCLFQITGSAYPFQSTLPYGSDFGNLEHTLLFLLFQSTLPYGSDG